MDEYKLGHDIELIVLNAAWDMYITSLLDTSKPDPSQGNYTITTEGYKWSKGKH